MKMSGLILREKTNVGKKQSITFNSPGNYVAPYGKTTVRIGGQGAAGTPPSGGNLASPAIPTSVYGASTIIGTTRFTTPATPPLPPNTPNDFYAPNQTTTSNFGGYYVAVNQPAYVANGNFGPNGYSLEIVWYSIVYYYGQPANYNPYVPGNTAPNTNIGGVYFPGGVEGGAAIVPQTPTTIAYSPSGFTVTVPSGGYITIDNI